MSTLDPNILRQEEEAPAPPVVPNPEGGKVYDTVETFYLPIYVLTAVFGAIFIIGPMAVRKGPYIGIIRCSIMLTAFCCWAFWVTMYIAQMNPLLGPRLHNTSVAWIGHKWGKNALSLSKTRRGGEVGGEDD